MQDKQVLNLINEFKEHFKDESKSKELFEQLQKLLNNDRQEIANNAKERFKAVVDNVVDGIITIDKKGKILTFNRTAESILGYIEEEVIGKNIKEIMPTNNFVEQYRYVKNFKKFGKNIGNERHVTGLRKDGSSFPLDLVVSKIQIGQEDMFIGVLRDTTEELYQKEELQQSQERLQSILDNVYEGIITIDSKGIIDSFNLAAENIFGYDAKEMIGCNVKMLMPEPYFSEHDGYLANYMSGGEAKVIGIDREVEGRRKDGSIFPLYLAVTQIRNHGKPLFVGMVRDLSEQKRLEKLKNEFVSTVSHELRTPLTSIRGSLGLIESGTMGKIEDKLAPLVKIALNNTERLILLINDILDMEKMESGQMDFTLEYIDLNTLIHEAVEANEGFSKEHNVHLVFHDFGERIEVYVDKNRIQQVLANLISNAVKYSPKDDTVTLRVSMGSQVRVEVHDNGPGIPDDFKKQIFQRFAQADSSDTKQKGGTGLGLNISKAIIEKLGGSIGFLSPLNEGTTFFFNLPVMHELKVVENKLESRRGKVLVVEDDHDIATLLQMMLYNEGIECDIAYNTTEAKQLLSQTHYDAMTLDIMLPGQDGISLLEDIRKEESLKDLSIVVVSAKALIKKEENVNAGVEVVDWINKPIDKERLISSMKQAMKVNKNLLPCILHVEDDPDIADLIKILLHDIGEIDLAVTKAEALKKLEYKKYDLILLDMMLPDGSGQDILPYIKEKYTAT
ncbi:MAG: PAS domain S-box protein, partial [Sulfurovum sp.]|nr:PAS domain S-box protein [Sulfurovum sp.]NNJ44400.1 PAS domain S-box protein [Sulfurovum sp.]